MRNSFDGKLLFQFSTNFVCNLKTQHFSNLISNLNLILIQSLIKTLILMGALFLLYS